MYEKVNPFPINYLHNRIKEASITKVNQTLKKKKELIQVGSRVAIIPLCFGAGEGVRNDSLRLEGSNPLPWEILDTSLYKVVAIVLPKNRKVQTNYPGNYLYFICVWGIFKV